MPAVVMRDYRAEHGLRAGGRILSDGDCDIHLDDEFLMIKGLRAHRLPYEGIEAIRQVSSAVELSLGVRFREDP